MLSRLRNHFGTAGLVVAIVALIAALGGGAYAATGGGGSASKAKQGKQGKPGKTGPAGPAGPAGPTGPAGPAGAKGDTGAAGTNGTNGTDGKTVLNGTATPTAAIGTLGDFYLETDVSKMYGPKAATGANGGWGSGTDLKGEEGSPWTLGGTLPPGQTETGTWTFDHGRFANFQRTTMSASFPIPLEAGIPAGKVLIAPEPTNCPGTVTDPQAEPGYFCVYTGVLKDAEFTNPGFFGPPIGKPSDKGLTAGTDTAGALIAFTIQADEASGSGTWAVTAPTP